MLSALNDFFFAENMIFKKLKTFLKKNPTAKRINIDKITAFINHSLGVFCSGRCNNINLKEAKIKTYRLMVFMSFSISSDDPLDRASLRPVKNFIESLRLLVRFPLFERKISVHSLLELDEIRE